MTIEGVAAPGRVRDYLYERMRGAREEDHVAPGGTRGTNQPDDDLEPVLRAVAEELRGVRLELERRNDRGSVPADATNSD